jgi:hypothetical protein
MAFEHEKRQAMRMLEAVENGSMSGSQAYGLLRDADPTLVYFIFTWLRANYHPGHPAAEGVLGRIVKLCSEHPALTQQIKTGQADSIVTWFEDAHDYREFRSAAFVDLVVEKLEG